MAGGASGETYQERTKGKDVRTSNIVAAKVGELLFLMTLVPSHEGVGSLHSACLLPHT